MTQDEQRRNNVPGGSPSESEVTASAGNTDVTTTNQPTGVPNGQAAAQPTTPTNDAPTGAGFEAPDEERISSPTNDTEDPTKANDYKQKIGVKVGDGITASAAEQLGKQVVGGSLPYTPEAKTEKEIQDTHERLMTDDPLYAMDYSIKKFKQMADERRPETDEERAAREKKEKRQQIWSAVGDGLMALSNLYFTTKGAPNMYNKANSQQDALQKRMDKEKAEREAREKEYNDLQIRLGDLYANRGRTVREMEAAAEARKQAREKAEREQEKHNWEKLAQPAAQATAEAKAKTAEEEAKHAEEYYSNRAQRVGGSGSKGSAFTAKYPVINADGKIIDRVYSKEEARVRTEKEGGGEYWPEVVTKSEYEKKDPVLGTTKTTKTTVKQTTTKKNEEKANGKAGGGSSNTIPRKDKEDNTMPGVK